MREILFRGKRKDNGEWIEGSVLQTEDECRIATSYLRESDERDPVIAAAYIVKPKTVGQYTGLHDKNGRKIFEGDIVKKQDDQCVGVVKYGVYTNPFNSDGLGGHVGFYIEWKEGWIMLRRRDILFWIDTIEVIGNIFDNQEIKHTER